MHVMSVNKCEACYGTTGEYTRLYFCICRYIADAGGAFERERLAESREGAAPDKHSSASKVSPSNDKHTLQLCLKFSDCMLL